MSKLKLIPTSLFVCLVALIAICFSVPLVAAAAGKPSFSATRLFEAGDTPYGLTVGDFNKDGIADLATANASSPGGVSMLLGNGAGSFQTAITNEVSLFLQSATSADINHDGNPDLIVSGLLGASLLWGNGDGTFQTATTLSGPTSPALAFGDFNGDNSPDIAYASGSIYIKTGLGNGDGTFQTGGNYLISVTAGPQFIVVKDMNRDGKNDLVVACSGSPGVISVLLGNGDGTFQDPINTNVGEDNYGLAADDFNSDNVNDVAVTDYNSGTVTVLLGEGDGSLLYKGDYNIGGEAQSVVAADFNGDGTNDLVATGSTNAAVFLGNGDGTFQASLKYDSLRLKTVVGDFNGDGKIDLASPVLNNTTSIGVFLGNGNGTFQATPRYAVEAGPKSIGIGDFNGDGKAELVVANANSTNVSVLLNNGDGTFQTRSNYLTGANPQSVAVADFNGLGTNDIVVANLNYGVVSLLHGNGDGTFQPAIAGATVLIGSSYVLTDDFDNDHKTDLTVLGLLGISVFKGNGNGTFQPTTVTTPGPFVPDQLATADFNEDGFKDLVFNNYGKSTVSVMLGKGDGSFGTATNFNAGTNLQSVAIGDFNGDGTNDLVAVGTGNGYPADGTIAILLGQGGGRFGPYTNCLPIGSFSSVAVGDFNGDGNADLAVADNLASQVEVLPGNGDGTFQPASVFAVEGGPSFVSAGDLNGDGRTDLAVANTSSGNISVLLNTFSAVGPVLKFLPANPIDKTLRFSWPASAADFTLEATTDLGSPNWLAPTAATVTNNGNVEVTVPIGEGFRFFRLHKP